jgi:hypothetical protein
MLLVVVLSKVDSSSNRPNYKPKIPLGLGVNKL